MVAACMSIQRVAHATKGCGLDFQRGGRFASTLSSERGFGILIDKDLLNEQLEFIRISLENY